MQKEEYLEDSQSITEMLRAMQELKQKLQSKKAKHLEQLKAKAIELQKQIDEANAELTEVIQTLKQLEVTPDELEGFPPQIKSAFITRKTSKRASVLFYGELMSAAEACRKLGIDYGSQNAKIPLGNYLRQHPEEAQHIKIL